MSIVRRTTPILLMSLTLAAAAGCGDQPTAGSDQPAAATTTTATTAAPDAPAPPADDSPAATLPIEQLAGQLVMTKLTGPTASVEELAAIRTLGVGGIILFGPSVVDEPQLRALLASLDDARAGAARRAGLPPGLLISVDQEGGTIRNVPFAPPEHTQPELAAGTVAAARTEALETGRALHDLGISMDLGPVADLASPPNRTMAGRAFGDDAATAAPFVGATVAGLQAGGVAAVAKHFPGFGAASANSDEAVAYVDRTRAELAAAELLTFRAAIAQHVDAVMVSHGIFRRLGGTKPGTVDPRIVRGLLREQLHYDGLAMTDSMNARGFREAWGDTVPRACPAAIAAGIDMVLLTGTMETARLCRARIIDAVRDGTLPESRVREAAARVVELQRRRAGR